MAKAKAAVESMPTGQAETVRDRILATARDLFYREGVRGVGVDTVVAQSGVAKTSLYRWFTSKDQLIACVVEEEAKQRWAAWDRTAASCVDQPPRERLRTHMVAIVRFANSPKYRGCPFGNVSVELPDPQHPARVVVFEVMLELRGRVRRLVDAIEGVRDPVALTDQLVLLIQGSLSISLMFGAEGPQKYLPAAADALVQEQLQKS